MCDDGKQSIRSPLHYDPPCLRSVHARIDPVCDLCKGTGEIVNPDFEKCRYPGHPSYTLDCDETNPCENAGGCWKGEIIPCPRCHGGNLNG